jgi:hypothetical protein
MIQPIDPKVESLRHTHEVEEFNMQATHAQRMKELEMQSNERVKNAELELARIEARWLSWLRIPITVVKLPVYLMFAIAYCIAVARKHEPSEEFWRLLR